MRDEEYLRLHRLEDTDWWRVARRYLVATLVESAGLHSARILDVGAGVGGNARLLERFGTVVAVDTSDIALRLGGTRTSAFRVRASAELLCLRDDSFDLATALDVLEHVDDNAALLELNRVLRPSGILVVTVPALSALWSHHDIRMGHRRRYQRRALRSVLERSGFEIVRTSYWNCLLLVPVAVLRLLRLRSGRRIALAGAAPMPSPINRLLVLALRLEAILASRIPLPFGVSLFCLARPTASEHGGAEAARQFSSDDLR